MLIVNADDFGRSAPETDAVLRCYERGRITSTTAMMFMADSARAAAVGLASTIDIGLHLNFSQRFTGNVNNARLCEYQSNIVRFLTRSRYALLLYHPTLREQFKYVYQAQVDEFHRLYGRPPSHVDGHQHKHLCTNMILDRVIPEGQKVRRNFSFWPGEKSGLNRAYRRAVDRTLEKRYIVTDFFFALDKSLLYGRMGRVFELAQTSVVELMTHPEHADESEYLMSDGFGTALAALHTASYASLSSGFVSSPVIA